MTIIALSILLALAGIAIIFLGVLVAIQNKIINSLTSRVGSLERSRDRMTQMNWQPVPENDP